MLLPVAALAEGEADSDEVARPGDEEGTALPSDGLADCAAILVAASANATNIVDRNNMRHVSGAWFGVSGDVASEEGGEMPEPAALSAKIADWSGRIGSVDAMVGQQDWMAYCADLGARHGLEHGYFKVTSASP
ncbi:hypothetical protein R5H30_20725 [Sulfitobacter sp. D35]|uniref:hypothetical protein n=1 Tax=Sulfitobacter sp. D35 TaxID=3083252 RepID=UPI00297002D3|nr:hypothetical protein [Sulfitobacter sp. D35]MDW4500426.1 hypothetical protein [Sulfitobacter sp. D35]